jgi:hypothetical protein
MISSTVSARLILFAFALAIALACVLGCGSPDGDVATTWSAETKSPDGHWLATAQSQQWGGPGTAYDATMVFLKKLDSSDPPRKVLQFSHQYGTMNLEMKWLTPTRLGVMYAPSARAGDHVNIDFQIAKFDGIEISIQDLSGRSANTFR